MESNPKILPGADYIPYLFFYYEHIGKHLEYSRCCVPLRFIYWSPNTRAAKFGNRDSREVIAVK